MKNITKLGSLSLASLHGTVVLSYDGTDIRLNSGGWRTATTMRHMNQAASDLGLDLKVFQKKGQWFVEFIGSVIPYQDNMTLGWDGIRTPTDPLSAPTKSRAFDL